MNLSREHDNILTIHVSGKERTCQPVPFAADRAGSSARQFVLGATGEQLERNYEAILRAKDIVSPVAYQILRELGSGRQGKVLLALRHGARGCITRHAIKCFNPGLYRDAEEYWTDMGRIAQQVGQLQLLQSPHLVTTESYEETQGVGYVQMEAIDGLDLERLMSPETMEIARNGSTSQEWRRLIGTLFRSVAGRVCLQPGVAVHILRAVLRGLERVHALRFLHSDIKPTNIMIDRLGGVKLIDFGRAVTIGERATFLLGSLQYMAPETHRREAGVVQSDFFSLGLVALEMLSGVPIGKEGLTEEELLHIKLHFSDTLSDMLPEDLRKNDALQHILRKFLAPDPAQRHASAVAAEAGEEGLKVISRQLVQAGLDTEYERELAEFMERWAAAMAHG